MMRPQDCLLAVRRADPRLEVGRVRRLGSGWGSWTFVSDSGQVFRFPRSAQAAAELSRTGKLLDRIAGDLSLPVPRYVAVGEWNGLPFVRYPLIEGQPLVDLGPLDNGTGNRIAEQLGTFVRSLHRVSVPRVRALFDDPSWAGACRLAVEAIDEHLSPLLAERDRERLARLTGDLEQVIAPEVPEVLLHGDLSLLNILVDPTTLQVTGVIDFEEAGIGDPAWDLRLLGAAWPSRLFDALLEAYGARGEELRQRIELYQEVAPLVDALERLDAGDTGLAATLVEQWRAGS
jgi:aminoglycoside 2''-phosphotransferase